MDRKSAASLSKTSFGWLTWRIIFFLALVLIFSPTVISHLLLWRFEQRFHFNVLNKPLYVPLLGSISFVPAAVNYGQVVEIRSGKIYMTYQIENLMPLRLRVIARGENLDVRFKNQLMKAIGRESLVFDEVEANFVTQIGKIESIDVFRAHSNEIEFNLQSKERLQTGAR